MQFNNYTFEYCGDKEYRDKMLFKVKSPNGNTKLMGIDEAKTFIYKAIEKNLAKSVKFYEGDTIEKLIKKGVSYGATQVLIKKFPNLYRVKLFDFDRDLFDEFYEGYKILIQNKDNSVYFVYVAPMSYEFNEANFYYHIYNIERLK